MLCPELACLLRFDEFCDDHCFCDGADFDIFDEAFGSNRIPLYFTVRKILDLYEKFVIDQAPKKPKSK